MTGIKVRLTPHLVDELAMRDRTVVVVDVLRTGTSIITALANGAREVILTATVDSAARVTGNLAGAVTQLAGERNDRMIEGFHFGNSPLEFTPDRVTGKAIVFLSTNGTPALVRARHARELALCAFVNITAVAAFIRRQEGDVEIHCAGNSGSLCLEDAVCAGMLLHLLADDLPRGPHPGDAATAALALYKSHARGIQRMLQRSEHGTALKDLGAAGDVLACAGIDTVPVVPLWDGSTLRLRAGDDRRERAESAR